MMTKKDIVAITVTFVIFSVVAVALLVRHTRSATAENRVVTLRLYNALQVGMPSTQAQTIVNSTNEFKLYTWRDGFLAKSDLILGSSNWHIFVSIRGDKVSKVAIRSEDTPGRKPVDAPSDKTA